MIFMASVACHGTNRSRQCAQYATLGTIQHFAIGGRQREQIAVVHRSASIRFQLVKNSYLPIKLAIQHQKQVVCPTTHRHH